MLSKQVKYKHQEDNLCHTLGGNCIMAFSFDDLKRKTGGLAQKGADWAQLGMNKASQMAGVAKLKAANLGEEDTIRKAYTELGRRYYMVHGAAPEAEFVDVIQEIEEAKAKIQANNAKIAETKEKADQPSEDIVFEVNVEDLPTEPVAEEEPAAEEVPAEETPAAEDEEELKFED